MRSVAVRTLVVALAVQLVSGQTPPIASAQARKPDGKKDERAIVRVGKTDAAKGNAERWAVVVGVDQYETKEIEALGGAVADAKAIREALIKYADFPDQQVMLLVSDGAVKPTKLNIMEKLEQIKQTAKPTDLLLFFFAGHGVQVDGQRYLLTYEARISSAAAIKSSALPASALMQEFEAIRVRDRVIMVDACRNDPTKPGNKPNVADEALAAAFTLQPTSEGVGGTRATFLSSSMGQSAYEWTEKRRGFFSWFIEQGLAGAAANWGKVTVTGLRLYLNEFVPQKVREEKGQLQIPNGILDGAELILVRSEKLPATVATLDKPPAVAPTRTLYGVIKDINGVSLSGATVTVAMASAARAVGGKPSGGDLTITTDEEGHFKLDGVPPDGEAKVTVTKDSYVPKTLTSSPKKMVVYLAKADAPVAQVRPPAPPPAVAAAPPPAPPTPRPETGGTRPPVKPSPAVAPPIKPPPVVVPPPIKPPVALPPTPAPAVAKVTAGADELAMVAYRTFLAEDFKEAENAAREALQADADNALANAVLGNAMAALGVITGDSQKTTAAKAYIEKALAKDPRLALGHSARGLTFYAEGKVAEARGEFERAVQLDPKLGAAHANLGTILSMQNKLPEAERECRAAIRLQPESAVPYNCLSDVLFRMGKFKDSAAASRDAIGRYELRDRILGLYYVQLAVTQYQQGRQEEAWEAVGRAKALGIDNHPAFPTIEKANRKKKG